MTNERDTGRSEYFFEGMRGAVAKAVGGELRALVPPFSYSVGDNQYLMKVAAWMLENGKGNEVVGLSDCMEYYLVEKGHLGLQILAEADEVDGGNVYYVAKVEETMQSRAHPEPDLVRELKVNGRKMRHLYGEALVDGISNRVDRHITDCSDCMVIPSEVVKDY
ncbi:MAG: hypothetical protein UT84_C0003G0109 [Candidatus Curtissbacteria bacterium GW2011_GWA1_40_16]|uniref:Uncharacterized protein n=1 Tax=Candidatus Curtissbacteria bacterium GW2011_GWA1_40_16 TaxID=1618405 RepID=A0A0G0REL0_9BACT|nr:MAG: hypothetical protein UT84_C0003G0109 [Candidatus Curtissbacteria bacterium GW2011_GWA1_40_16]